MRLEFFIFIAIIILLMVIYKGWSLNKELEQL